MTDTKLEPAGGLRVVIVDDCPLLRNGLCTVLRNAGLCISCISHLSPDEAIAHMHYESFNFVILGAPLADHPWLRLLKQLIRERPSCHVLVLSSLEGTKHEIAAMRAGASGYLNKTSDIETVLMAVRKTSDGKNYVSHDLVHAMIEQLNGPKTKSPEDLLSAREYEVLRGLAAGKSSKELAAELHLSSKTVSTYRTRVCTKLGVKSNAGIVRYALKHKLLS